MRMKMYIASLSIALAICLVKDVNDRWDVSRVNARSRQNELKGERHSAHDCAVLSRGSFDLQGDAWATTHGHRYYAAAVKPDCQPSKAYDSKSRTDAPKKQLYGRRVGNK
jgi:hypothetical protein